MRQQLAPRCAPANACLRGLAGGRQHHGAEPPTLFGRQGFPVVQGRTVSRRYTRGVNGIVRPLDTLSRMVRSLTYFSALSL